MNIRFKSLIHLFLVSLLFLSPANAMHGDFEEVSLCSRVARKVQNWSYQLMAATVWDPMMGGFKPAREKAMDLLEVQSDDKVLFVGEGSGLDFEVLPDSLTKENLWAFDYSSVMVAKAKKKAASFGIPEDQCVEGDAQQLTYGNGEFNKIFFPLSLGSIPNPTLALKEAERVLGLKGKIVILEKLVDDEESISYARRFINFFTRFIFADINRNLTHMLGGDSSLKIVHYESTNGLLTGFLASTISPYYRLAVLVRDTDYPHLKNQGAKLETKKDQ